MLQQFWFGDTELKILLGKDDLGSLLLVILILLCCRNGCGSVFMMYFLEINLFVALELEEYAQMMLVACVFALR